MSNFSEEEGGEKEKRRTRKFLLGIFLVALGLRLATIAVLPKIEDNSWTSYARRMQEEGKYYVLDRNHSTTGDLKAYSQREPLLPLFVYVHYKVFGRHPWPPRVSLALLGSLTCLVIYQIGKLIFGPQVGKVAACLAVVYPKFLWYCVEINAVALNTFLVSFFVWALVLMNKHPRFGRSALAGFLGGVTLLVRSTIYWFTVPLLGWFLTGEKKRRRGLAHWGVFLLCLVAASSPWVIRNYLVHKAVIFTTTGAGRTLWLSNNLYVLDDPRGWHEEHQLKMRDEGYYRGLSETEVDRLNYECAIKWIRENPGEFLILAGKKFLRFWRVYPHPQFVGRRYVIIGLLSFGPLVPFFLWGFWGTLGKRPANYLLHLLIVYYTALHMVSYAVTRYRVVIMPYVIILASWGLIQGWMHLKKRIVGARFIAPAQAGSDKSDPYRHRED